jgi:hypothetical protein
MAVYTGPERGEASGVGGRLISSGGNVFTVYDHVKVGIATRGRGHWTGKDRKGDSNNPDVDNPQLEPVNELHFDEAKDQFDDDKDPYEAMRENAQPDASTTAQLLQAKKLIMQPWGVFAVQKAESAGAVYTLRGLKMDILLSDPETLQADDLLKSANEVKRLISQASGRERVLLTEYAGRLIDSIKKVVQADQTLVEKAQKFKPQKAVKKTADKNGKTQYQYQKKGDGKGPNSDGGPKDKMKAAQTQQQAPQPQPDPGAITPPTQAVDIEEFCGKIGVGPGNLERFAAKKTKEQFVGYWMQQKELVTKFGLQPAYLGLVYDSLISPPQQAAPAKSKAQNLAKPGQQEAPQAAMVQPKPQAQPQQGAMKSLIVFNSRALTDTRPLVKSVLTEATSRSVQTVDDLRSVLKDTFNCNDQDSYPLVLTTLRRWTKEGLVTLQK